ncbi:hypothetical protein ES705_25752 [subsurface metagenome]
MPLNEIEIPSGDPLYTSKVSITLPTVRQHRRLYNYMVHYWRNNSRSLDFPPSVNDILTFVPQLCFVPCFFLAYTCCRVNELKQLRLSDIKNRRPFKIKASKSKRVRYIKSLNVFKPKTLHSIDPDTLLYVVSYDHLKNAIRSAKKRASIEVNMDRHDLTHIFRHLITMYKHKKGVEDSVLSDMLGHLSPQSLRSYIH